MNESGCRIAPLTEAELTDRQRAVLQPFGQTRLPNVLATLVRAPDALEAAQPWMLYLLAESSLPRRLTEFIILRIGTKTKADYEISIHRDKGLEAGLSEGEVEALINPGLAHSWSAKDAALLTMCDEIVASFSMSDATWQAMSAAYTEREIMDAVYTAAHYVNTAIILKCFKVPIDAWNAAAVAGETQK